MELLEQCRIWHENDEHQKIIDALEAIPEGERTRAVKRVRNGFSSYSFSMAETSRF